MVLAASAPASSSVQMMSRFRDEILNRAASFLVNRALQVHLTLGLQGYGGYSQESGSAASSRLGFFVKRSSRNRPGDQLDKGSERCVQR